MGTHISRKSITHSGQLGLLLPHSAQNDLILVKEIKVDSSVRVIKGDFDQEIMTRSTNSNLFAQIFLWLTA